MQTLLENFHFIRSYWLFALIPAFILLRFLFSKGAAGNSDQWSEYVDAHLLRHLTIKNSERKIHKLGYKSLFLISSLIIIALAGPTWQQSKQPAYNAKPPIVAVLSLAQSMNANDIAPTRLKRAVHKLQDILANNQGAEKALVIYSDIPFIAAPLTNDDKVIEQMLPELSTSLMPVLGDRLDLAIEQASGLLARTKAKNGQIILLTDSAGEMPAASVAAAKRAQELGYTVSAIAIGTQTGAALKTANGQLITNNTGQKIQSKLSLANLESIVKEGGGNLALLTADDSDLNQIMQNSNQPLAEVFANTALNDNAVHADDWTDMGYWLLIIPVLLSSLLFRKGLVFAFVFMLSGWSMQPQYLQAATEKNQSIVTASQWQSLWKTADQQGAHAFEKNAYGQAAQIFENKSWTAAAEYRKGDFTKAASAYSQLNPTVEGYNLANAQAKSGDLEGALQSYDAYLKLYPQHENARFNRDLVATLLKEQQEQKQQEKPQDKSADQQNEKQDSAESGDNKAKPGEGKGQGEKQNSGEAKDQEPGKNQDKNQDQNKGKEQSNKQGQDKLKGQSQDQQQAAGGSEKKKSEPQESKAQGNEQDQNAAGEQGQSASESKDQKPKSNAGHEQAKEPLTDGSQRAEGEQLNDEAAQQEAGILEKLISKALQGNADEAEKDQQAADQKGAKSASQTLPAQVSQKIEQQLRRVPDDPTGLLRARIRQHYMQLRAAQQ